MGVQKEKCKILNLMCKTNEKTQLVAAKNVKHYMYINNRINEL